MISIEEQSKLNNHSLTHIDNDFFFIYSLFWQNDLYFLKSNINMCLVINVQFTHRC